MSLIEVSQLTKVFRHAIKQPGLLGSIKHLVTQQHADKRSLKKSHTLAIAEGPRVGVPTPFYVFGAIGFALFR